MHHISISNKEVSLYLECNHIVRFLNENVIHYSLYLSLWIKIRKVTAKDYHARDLTKVIAQVS